MINQLAHLNWISILAAFIAYFLLGGLWFTVLFGKQYKFSLGKQNENLKNNNPIFIVGPAVCALIITVASAILMYALKIHSVTSAIEFAFIIGIGYLFSNTVMIAINPNIPRPILYGVISGFYHLTGILIASIILVVMK